MGSLIFFSCDAASSSYMLRNLVKNLANPPARQQTIAKWQKLLIDRQKIDTSAELRGVWPKYEPESPKTLVQPLLLTEFDRFTSKRHLRKRVPFDEAQSPFKSLETSIYAQMLASPPRMDTLSRTILPTDLLIRIALVNTGENAQYMLTPLAYKDRTTGPVSYVTCSKKALMLFSTSKIGLLIGRFANSVSVDARRSFLRNAKQPIVRPNLVEFYDGLMIERIMAEAKKVAKTEKSIQETEKSHRLDVEFLSSFLSENELNSLKKALSVDFAEPVVLNANAKDLLIMLYRHYLYRKE